MNTQISTFAVENKQVIEFHEKFNAAIMQSCCKYKLNDFEKQEVYSMVLEKFFAAGKAKIDSSKGEPEGYVRRIACNCACDIVRSKKRREKNMVWLDDPDMPEIPDSKGNVVHDMDMKELGKILHKGFLILEETTENKRNFSIFIKSFLEKRKTAQIAEEYNISSHDVSSIQFRLRTKLMKIITDLFIEKGLELPC